MHWFLIGLPGAVVLLGLLVVGGVGGITAVLMLVATAGDIACSRISGAPIDARRGSDGLLQPWRAVTSTMPRRMPATMTPRHFLCSFDAPTACGLDGIAR